MCTSIAEKREKKGMTVSGTVSHTTKIHNYAEQASQKSSGGKVFVTGQYNAKKALMNTGALFAEKETVELPPCDSKLLGEGDSLLVV